MQIFMFILGVVGWVLLLQISLKLYIAVALIVISAVWKVTSYLDDKS